MNTNIIPINSYEKNILIIGQLDFIVIMGKTCVLCGNFVISLLSAMSYPLHFNLHEILSKISELLDSP